jgi:peptide-methionine (S)-S-oxide reductase
MQSFLHSKQVMVSKEKALKGRPEALWRPGVNIVTGTSMAPPYPEDCEKAVFALGCFWGAERLFWALPGIFTTAVGYCGGFTQNPTYEEVCSGKTGHAESVLVIYFPDEITYTDLLKVFFEGHDPTQFMKQGNDVGTQYRSAIFTFNEEQYQKAQSVLDAYQKIVSGKGYGKISTEISSVTEFYFAEEYHQQYLAKNPWGYCGLKPLGITCPI